MRGGERNIKEGKGRSGYFGSLRFQARSASGPRPYLTAWLKWGGACVNITARPTTCCCTAVFAKFSERLDFLDETWKIWHLRNHVKFRTIDNTMEDTRCAKHLVKVASARAARQIYDTVTFVVRFFRLFYPVIAQREQHGSMADFIDLYAERWILSQTRAFKELNFATS